MIFVVFCIIFLGALLSTVGLGYGCIPLLRRMCASGKRAYTPERHADKSATPSCGGIMFLLSIVTIALSFAWYTKAYVILWPLGIMLMFAAVGGYDDICKMWYQVGISERRKLLMQILCACIFAVWWYQESGMNVSWVTPLGIYYLDIGIWYIPWIVFMIVGVSNSINLTDGVDGLAASAMFWYAVALGCGVTLDFVIPMEMITLYAAVLGGAMLGFLWHNSYPAHVFMGDVGSLSLGALAATLAIISGIEWLLPLVLCIPCIETLSVMLQVGTYKLTGWRPFHFAPIHHHFELIGWHEATIVTRAQIATIVCSACALVAVLMAI